MEHLQSRLKLREDLDDNKRKINEFMKQNAVDKAAELIRTFEEMAETDTKIDMRKLRKSVLNNLVSNNRDKEPSESWWSYQLLMKLGVVPDPNAAELDENQLRISKMTAEEREAKMREIGLVLPKRKMIEF